LNERLNNLGSVLSDLNTKLKTSEEEKASLLTAIRLLQTDIETGCKTALNHQSQITHKEANAISKGNNTKTALERNPVAHDLVSYADLLSLVWARHVRSAYFG
jgi:septal ring factor EnvC (AmiA/AmiB activator)